MDTVQLVLKPSNKVINGMIAIEIKNLNTIIQNELPVLDCSFVISYKFRFKYNQINYENNEWKSQEFSVSNINYHNKFWLKVPLFLSSYSLEFNLLIKIIKTKSITNKLSISHIVNIPSILIETTHENGDRVQYFLPDSGHSGDGVIMEILDNDMIKIQDDDNKTITINASKVYRDGIEAMFVIDITNRAKAETDLILRCNDMDKMNMYYGIRDALFVCYENEMRSIETQKYQIQYIPNWVAMNVYSFLFLPEYGYRVQCLFDDTYLFYEQEWKYNILRTYINLRNGIKMPRVQDICSGYTCDICRVEVLCYEYMFHCNIGDIHKHDFCMSCLHSLISQYHEMKPFLSGLLSDTLDDNSINEIIAYCVGKVIKFDVDDNDQDVDM